MGSSVKVTFEQRPLEGAGMHISGEAVLGRGSSCVGSVGGTFEDQQRGMWLEDQGELEEVSGRSRGRMGDGDQVGEVRWLHVGGDT